MVNIWFCPDGNTLETSYIKSMFRDRPFFIFHPLISLAEGICCVMNFDYDKHIDTLNELLKDAQCGDVMGSIAKYCIFFLPPYGDITVNFIQ